MVNAYDWSGWNVASPTADAFPGFGAVADRPEALGTLDPYRTPEEDWDRLLSQSQPFWTTRTPMEDIGQRLRARYLLAAPEMITQNVRPSFGQYLSDYPGRFGADPTFASYGAAAPMYQDEVARTPAEELAELRSRAREAAQAATTAPGIYAAGAVPETDEFRRRSWLASQFGLDADSAQANQLRVANLLALQRPGERDPYRGQMASAIRNAMSNLYQQRLNVGAPRQNFLNWYLQQTDPDYKKRQAIDPSLTHGNIGDVTGDILGDFDIAAGG
mgnify:CR=1 FL=1